MRSLLSILFAWIIFIASNKGEAQKMVEGLPLFQRKHCIIVEGRTGLAPKFTIFVPQNERDLQFPPNTKQRSWSQ